MSVVRVDVIDGPNVQAHGEHRGRVEVELSDGRIFTPSVRAPDAPTWANRIVDIGQEVLDQTIEQDSQEGVDADTEVTAHKLASVKQRAVAYLRKAWEMENAYEAFLLFDKFNDYRNAQGWNLNQVQANLIDEGLTVEEWDAMKTAYQYLAAAGRPAIMSDARDIQANWDNR